MAASCSTRASPSANPSTRPANAGMPRVRLPLLLALLALASFSARLSVCRAQMGDPFTSFTPEGVGVRHQDLPYIRCAVCKRVSQKLIQLLEEKRARASKRKPVGELQVIELTEKICSRKAEEGTWILKTDMEERGDKIELVEYDYIGECRSECRTLERACEDIMGYHDTDVAELLQKSGMSQARLEQALCHDLSGACTKPTPPLPEGRAPGEAFEAEQPKKDTDYKKMAGELGIQTSVMHDVDKWKLPDDVPVMEPPKHLTNPSKKKKVKAPVKSDWETMSEL